MLNLISQFINENMLNILLIYVFMLLILHLYILEKLRSLENLKILKDFIKSEKIKKSKNSNK